jgi:hypothetical protein
MDSLTIHLQNPKDSAYTACGKVITRDNPVTTQPHTTERPATNVDCLACLMHWDAATWVNPDDGKVHRGEP